MTSSFSITRRLILTVLLLEMMAALGLIAAVVENELHVQSKAFDANLRGTSDALMGAVQDAEDEGDNVMLDLRGIQLEHDAIYRVQDESGRVLGESGTVPLLTSEQETFHGYKIQGRSYRFFTRRGERIIDPGKNGGVRHSVTIIYGAPDGHIWHEVFEAMRFFAIATAVLLSMTALLMIWLMQRWLRPIRDLAVEAGKISPNNWRFRTPNNAKRIEELCPLGNALEVAMTRLQRSFEQQKRFTNDAAHELKTDLAIVKSSLQLLSMKKRTVEEYSRGLSLSLDDCTRLEVTIQKMLTLARLEQTGETEGKTCFLKEALEEAAAQSNPFATLRNISVMIHADANVAVPLDNRDAVLLCSNIVFNALQHSPDGRTVSLDLLSDKSHACLTVRDFGEGISEEDRQLLFEPFYRGDASRSRKSGGTGLGLSICKAICGRIGGCVEIANHPEGGAIVTVRLPLSSTNT